MMADDFAITDLQSREIYRPCWAQHREPLLAGQSVSASISLPGTRALEGMLCLPSSTLRISFFDIVFARTLQC